MISNLEYVFYTVYAACVDKLEEKIDLLRSFLPSLALSRRTFSTSGGRGARDAFAPIAPLLPTCLRACVPACLRACVPACLTDNTDVSLDCDQSQFETDFM